MQQKFPVLLLAIFASYCLISQLELNLLNEEKKIENFWHCRKYRACCLLNCRQQHFGFYNTYFMQKKILLEYALLQAADWWTAIYVPNWQPTCYLATWQWSGCQCAAAVAGMLAPSHQPTSHRSVNHTYLKSPGFSLLQIFFSLGQEIFYWVSV